MGGPHTKFDLRTSSIACLFNGVHGTAEKIVF